MRIHHTVVARMAKVLDADLSSPSGLRWKVWNGAKGERSRSAGDTAGGLNSAGHYAVSFEKRKYLCTDVMAHLHRHSHLPRKAA